MPKQFALRLIRSEFVRDATLVFAASMIVNVANYGIHFALSRKLGVADYGALAALLNLLTLVAIPSAVGTMIVVKFVAELHAVDDRSKIRLLTERVLLLSAGLAALLFAVACILSNQIAAYFHIASGRPVVMAAVVMVFSLVLPLVRGVLQGTQDFARLAVSNIMEAVGRILLAVALVYAGFGLAGAFAGSALASLLAALYTMNGVRRHWAYERTPLVIDLRRVLITTVAISATTACLTVMGFIDLPLVKHFFSPQEAGIYGAVSVCGKMIFFLVGFIPTVVLPKAATRAARQAPVKPVLLQGLGGTVLLSAGALIAFFAMPAVIVRVTYGPSFLPAAQYIFAYGVAMAFLAGTGVMTTYKIGLHRFGFVIPLVAIACAEVVGINLFHHTLWDVVIVLLAGHAASFLFSSLRLFEPAWSSRTEGNLVYSAGR